MRPTRVLACASLAVLLALSSSLATAAEELPLWKTTCGPCHGTDGRGKTPAGRMKRVPDLTQETVRARLSLDYISQLVRSGRLDSKTGETRMPAFGHRLTDEEIQQLANHVLELGE